MSRRVLVLIAVVLCVAPSAGAQNEASPSGAVAWWRFEPAAARDEASPELVGPSVALLGAGRPDVTSFGAFLLAATRSRVPHTLALLDVRQTGGEGRAVEAEFSMVLEVRSGAGNERSVEQLDAAMRQRGAPPRAVDVPGGRHATVYGTGGGAGPVLGVCSTPGTLLLARGEGTLPRWLEGSTGADDSGAHLHAERGVGAPGRFVFESYVNLNLLRRALEPSGTLIDGAGAAVLRACGLANGRSIMLHARRLDPAEVSVRDPVLDLLPQRGERAGGTSYSGPALIVIDGTWSARSETPGQIGRTQLTEGFWPGEGANRLRMQPPAADVVVVVRIDRDRPGAALETVLAAAPSMLSPEAAAEYPRRAGEWRRGHNGALQRTLHSLGGWLVVAYAGERPGILTAYVELKQGVEPARVGADLLALLTPVSDGLVADTTTATWSLPLGPAPARCTVAWTLTRARGGLRPVLVASLDLSALCGGTEPTDGKAAREAARRARESLEGKP